MFHDSLPEETGGRVGDGLEVSLKSFLSSPVLGGSLGVLPRLRLALVQASAHMACVDTCSVHGAMAEMFPYNTRHPIRLKTTPYWPCFSESSAMMIILIY